MAGHSRAKKGLHREQVEAVKAKIIAASANEKTLREIARETKKSMRTVGRVVQGSEE
jgi:hypothetical protein